ncbi:MAG: hypothetical protein WD226_04445 [Planctomycetota bacterium]
MRRWCWWLPFLALGVGACGWHAGPGPAPDLPEVARARTIGVELFDRSRYVLERNQAPEIHAALARAAVDHSGLRLVAAEQADVVVRGAIVEYRRRAGVRSVENELLETGVRLTLEASLVERRTGLELGRARPRVWSSFAIDGEGPGGLGTPAVEGGARTRGYEFLARKLIFDLFEGPRLTPTPAPDADASLVRSP